MNPLSHGGTFIWSGQFALRNNSLVSDMISLRSRAGGGGPFKNVASKYRCRTIQLKRKRKEEEKRKEGKKRGRR